MKKFYLSLLFIFSAVLAYATPEPYAHLQIYDYMNKSFFEKLIKGEEATYSICIDTTKDGKNIVEENQAKKIFLNSVSNWKTWTKYYIYRYEDKDKFNDILKILNKANKLQQKPCSDYEENNTDLNIVFTNRNENAANLGRHQNGIIFIYVRNNLNDPKKMTETMTHELGHAFGLADEYSGSIYTGSFIYNSRIRRPSIMDNSQYITCDDADGFITSIDRLNGTKREFYSLCKDALFIKNGRGAVNKNNPTYKFKENYDYYDAEIQILYLDEFPDHYGLDITLKNFIMSKEALNILYLMGFKIDDYETLERTVVKIHGAIHEEIGQHGNTVYLKTPIGLWTSTLYLQNFDNLEPKQIVTIDFLKDDETGNPILTDIETNKSEPVYTVNLPLLDLFPNAGYGIKEIVNEKYIKNKLRNKLISDLRNNTTFK